ncbi:MAG: hypothetical protein AB7L92_08595 [Alphaproteobacteria bacterium]
MKKLVSITLALAVSAAMPANAGDKHRHGDKDKMGHFDLMDKNGDGVVNQSEHHAWTRKMFKKLDANSDQLISKKELASFHHHDFSQQANWEDDSYDSLRPAAGRDNRSFGSHNDRVYGNTSNTVSYEGGLDESNRQHERPYNKH